MHVTIAISSRLHLFAWLLPPLPYHLGMHRVIAVGIESEAMPEARLSRLPEGVPSLTLERKTGLGGDEITDAWPFPPSEAFL